MGVAMSPIDTPLPDKYYDDYVKAMPSQAGKVVAVTGTTSGTGFQAAKALVSRGGTVLCLNRPSERAKSALAQLSEACGEGGTTHQVDCDLQSFDSVHAAADAVKKLTPSTGLNALVNNAGVMALAKKPTTDGYEVQMQTNHLSHFLLAALLMPSLEVAAGATGEARVVNQSIASRNMPREPLEAKYMQAVTEGVDLGDDTGTGREKRYQQSKLANSVFTLAMKEKLAATGSKVKAQVAHPGISSTSITSNTSSDSPGSLFDKPFVIRIMRMFKQGQGDGALPLLAATVAPEACSGDFYTPRNRGVFGLALGDHMNGPPVKMNWVARGDKEKLSTDAEAQKVLWECSEAATGVKFMT